MKKSTLITTIAMIVVVVVALSTATYAWFTSSSTAVATVNLTTTATGDWSMIQGTYAFADNTVSLTFNGSAADTIPLTATTIHEGLWAPTAAISTAIATSDAATTLTAPAGFVSAETTSGVHGIKKLQTLACNGAVAAETTGYAYPFALRVLNVSGSDQTLQLNITLNAHDDGTSNSMYAAAAVRFYVYEIKNGAAGQTYTSGYNYAVAGTGFGEGETLNNITVPGTRTVTKSADQDMTEGLGAKTSGNATDGYQSTAVTLANYTLGNIASAFPAAGGANPNLGIAQGDHVRTYTFDMSEYAAGDFSNVIIYAWIDGWTANASAQSADFDICFGFTSNKIIHPVANS